MDLQKMKAAIKSISVLVGCDHAIVDAEIIKMNLRLESIPMAQSYEMRKQAAKLYEIRQYLQDIKEGAYGAVRSVESLIEMTKE